MPYSSEDYQPPTLPEIRSIKSFEEVREAVQQIMQYLQRLVAADHAYFQHLKHNLDHAAVSEGPVIASAATITPSHFIHRVSGTATITTIDRPANYIGQLMLISLDGFYLASGGNISLFQTPNFLNPTANIMLTYVPSQDLWIADTCRLHTAPTVIRIGNRDIGDTE